VDNNKDLKFGKRGHTAISTDWQVFKHFRFCNSCFKKSDHEIKGERIKLPRWNYVARRKPEKKPAWEVKRERMYDLLNLIEKEKKIKYFDAQMILKWGDGVMDKILREVLTSYSNEIRFDKEKRELIHISVGPYQKQQVVKHVQEKPGLSDNELNMMHTMKQEAQK